MTLTFADHGLFQRNALRAAIGSAATTLPAVLFLLSCLCLEPPFACAPFLAAGALSALSPRRGSQLILIAAGALFSLLALTSAGAREPSLAVVGSLLAIGVFEARGRRARESGEPLPRPWTLAVSATLAAGVGWNLDAAFARAPLLTFLMAGLWFAAACAPLHLRFTVDSVEQRLAELRPTLLGDLRPLVDRIALARQGAVAALLSQRTHFGPLVATLKAELDGLTLAALELAGRGAELARATPASADEDLSARAAELRAAAAASADELAKSSYLRAAETLGAQLDHVKAVRRGRDRIAARLQEEVAQLDRARFSLLLLQGANAERSAPELELLSSRMRRSASAFEAEAEATAEVMTAAAALRA